MSAYGSVSRATRAKRSEQQSTTTTTNMALAAATKSGQPSADALASSREQPSEANEGAGKTAAPTTRLVFGLSSRTNRLKHDEYAERRISQAAAPAIAAQDIASNRSAAAAAGAMSENGSPADSKSTAKNSIRPSRLGNFYKPQEPQEPQVAKPKAAKRADSSPSRGANLSRQASGEAKRAPAAAKQPEAKRTESKEGAPELRPEAAPGAKPEAKPEARPEARPEAKPVKMQFNIPPPPPQASTRRSVVSYAKARIYDRPASSAAAGQSLLNAGAIPESILSGFKPPKQVNVSKACEKWEGGEPFAKSKSRQRLAAQAAGKKLLHGTWSMTSVVVTQQLQLQQALANASATSRSDLMRSDPSVKILTRGSVLERVQQFEKVPSSSGFAAPAPGAQAADDEGDLSASEITIGAAPLQVQADGLDAGASRQAAYKTRVSSIQSGAAAVDQLEQLNQMVAVAQQSPPALSSARRLSLRRRSSSSSTTNSTSSIPKFYHPNGRPNTYEIELQKKNIVACFDKLPDRKAQLAGSSCRRHFHSIALACGFSEYFKEPLYLYVKHQMTNSNLLHGQAPVRKQSGLPTGPLTEVQARAAAAPRPLARAASIDTSTLEKIQSQTFISCDQFLTCWRNMIGCCFDNAARFVHLLTLGQRNYLLPDDLVPLVQSVIDDHPGLKFLRAAPDFHLRYIQTVIARIFYCLNKSWTGKISIAELRQSNLLAVLLVLSQEEDINQITDYFSYEHFYVIYCKFWALDTDHDLLISREDLARHNDAAISSRIIERLFTGIVSKHVQQTGKMSYSDFVWFLIAEEDKKHPRAIEYWFRLMDLDGDGYISMYEMEYFYYEQSKRLELMNIEALPFLDSACQILDLVNPKEKNKISLSDLKRTKMATIFFDTFINLEKYLEHESREFVSTRDVLQGGVVISDWDRYASEEYESLVSEETTV